MDYKGPWNPNEKLGIYEDGKIVANRKFGKVVLVDKKEQPYPWVKAKIKLVELEKVVIARIETVIATKRFSITNPRIIKNFVKLYNRFSVDMEADVMDHHRDINYPFTFVRNGQFNNIQDQDIKSLIDYWEKNSGWSEIERKHNLHTDLTYKCQQLNKEIANKTEICSEHQQNPRKLEIKSSQEYEEDIIIKKVFNGQKVVYDGELENLRVEDCEITSEYVIGRRKPIFSENPEKEIIREYDVLVPGHYSTARDWAESEGSRWENAESYSVTYHIVPFHVKLKIKKLYYKLAENSEEFIKMCRYKLFRFIEKIENDYYLIILNFEEIGERTIFKNYESIENFAKENKLFLRKCFLRNNSDGIANQRMEGLTFENEKGDYFFFVDGWAGTQGWLRKKSSDKNEDFFVLEHIVTFEDFKKFNINGEIKEKVKFSHPPHYLFGSKEEIEKPIWMYNPSYGGFNIEYKVTNHKIENNEH